MGDAFAFFDQVICVRLDPGERAWEGLAARLERLGVADRVLVLTPDQRLVEPRVRVAMTHREALRRAAEADVERLLVLEDQCLLLPSAAWHLRPVLSALAGRPWGMLYLGAVTMGREIAIEQCPYLARGDFEGGYAIGYTRAAIDRILGAVPADASALADWIDSYRSFDRFLATQPDRLLAVPRVASVPHLLPYEDPALREGYLA
jgi:hypothetical protein